MPFEWMVGTRYLSGSRRQWAPSSITMISVSMIALGVALLVLVLSILGGFEGDLRNKILGTKAHLLVTGPNHGELTDYEGLMDAIASVEGVVGAAGFVESDVMVASATNYSGVVLRGIRIDEAVTSSEIASYMREGKLEWLESPDEAISAVQSPADRLDALQEEARQLSARAAERAAALEEELDATDVADSLAAQRLEAVAGAIGSGSGGGAGDADAAAGDDDSAEPVPRRRGPPPSLSERLEEVRESPSGGPPGLDQRIDLLQPRQIPGVVIGAELQETLRVRVGDQIQIINPDGDLGPTGPIPRARPYRVVGVFYSGLYEYDNTMVYATLDSARDFLNVPAAEVTGIEIRIRDLRDAEPVGAAIEAVVAAERDDAEVQTWMELNERLFSALELEQFVIGLLLMFIVLVASFATVCVLTMIVIQRADEIAILRSMGASPAAIRRIFVVQGMTIGVSGIALGLITGLGLVAYLLYVGFPLDPSVYYIDRVPVELAASDVLYVTLGVLAISAVATLLPSMQAARLDPADALRHD